MTVVLDSSALLAVILGEPGKQNVASRLEEAVMSAVNVQEVYLKLMGNGVSPDVAQSIFEATCIDVLPHDAEDALGAAQLASATRQLGSGLGDRTCMALGIRLGVPVLTADRAWAQVEAEGLNVELIR